MKLFNYYLFHKPTTLADANYYILTEEDFPSVNLSHILTLYNNQYREVQIKSDKPFDNIQKNQYFSFDVKDVVSFLFKIGTNSIVIKRRQKASDLLVDYWLYHTFLPILLTFENKYYFLHAGAVEIENKSVLFIADSFGGKSTLTDFFIKKNHTMISDDKVATFEKDEYGTYQSSSVDTVSVSGNTITTTDEYGYVDILKSSFITNSKEIHGDRMIGFESPVSTEVDSSEEFSYIQYQLSKYNSKLLEYLNTIN